MNKNKDTFLSDYAAEERKKFGGGNYRGNWPLVKNPYYVNKRLTPDLQEYVRVKQHKGED